MPTYEYRCAKCGEQLEVFQSFSDEPLKKHAGCGGKLTKVLSSVGIVLKGSGFYKTDSRSSSSGKRNGSKRDESSSTSSSGDGGSSSTDSGSKSNESTGSTKSTGDKAAKSGSGEKKSAAKSA